MFVFHTLIRQNVSDDQNQFPASKLRCNDVALPRVAHLHQVRCHQEPFGEINQLYFGEKLLILILSSSYKRLHIKM